MDEWYYILSSAFLFSRTRVGKLLFIIFFICVLYIKSLHG